MVVEKVEVASGESVDFGESVVHGLRVEAATTLEEGFLVAEVADVRTAARDDDGIWDEVEAASDQIAAHGREPFEGAHGGIVARRGHAGGVVGEEAGPGVLAGAGEDGIGMRGGLVREGGDVQTAEADENAAGAIRVGDRVGAARTGDVDLDDDEIGAIVEAELLDVLVDDFGVMDRVEVAARVASPRGGKREYLMGRKRGLVASVSAGRMNFTCILLEYEVLYAAKSSDFRN